MSLTGLFAIVHRSQGYREVRDALLQGRAASLPLPEAAKPYVLGALWRDLDQPLLVMCPRPDDARRLHEQLLCYCGDNAPVYHFAEVEVLPYERLVLDSATVHQRLHTLAALSGVTDTERPPLVVASAAGVMQKTVSRETFLSLCHTLKVGQRIHLEPLLQQWVHMGYTLEPSVEVPGTASRRGGIIDVFPPGASRPARIELWGDQIESIRLFDPGSQRSQEAVETVTIIPAQEVLPDLANRQRVEECIGQLDFSNCTTANRDRIEDELSLLLAGQQGDESGFYAGFFNQATILDYFSQGILVLNEPAETAAAAQDLDQRSEKLKLAKAGRGELPGNFPPSHHSWHTIEPLVDSHAPRCHVSRWEVANAPTGLQFAPPPCYWGRMDAFIEGTRSRLREGHRVVVASQHAQRLTEVLREHDIGATGAKTLDAVPDAGSVTVAHLALNEGWTLPVDGVPVTLLSDAEVFGTAKRRASRPTRSVRREAFLSELTPDSFVVHADHGIGRFTGTTTVAQDGAQREYLVVQYAEGDKLYVPTDHLDRVAPYVAAGDQEPSLTRLGTQEWERAKERVRRSAQELAQELLTLYAERELISGISFAPDAPWQRELEDSFPYVETPDQYQAIQEVKADMERARPMDRLVCGDVGYGKTEVALRAAFKVVMDGYQVAVLVPTTVLAQQHYATFSERLAPFPVKVEVLSRFRTPSEQAEVVGGLKDGTVDIVIGTHRLLQRDVGFKRLGLVVIDEEQRFGVEHKERLKHMRQEVDVLTLTATPIPRTLHMSLAGVRDMSTMETPPEERLPIKTYVSEYSQELVREAILRELDRGGQVFFLHNRVHSIRRVADELRHLVPEATVEVAHGRMPEEDLAQVMADFVAGRSDVLVCTTIIEAGLDIPSANTLIIDRADRLGLAQLYQLRGRIGRSAHRAYAYLLIPAGQRITDTAQKRLQTILAATELGAGFRIAMKDLEIRGAGNILGPEQSGHINAVGFDLYSRLLTEAVEDLKAQRAGVPAEEREAERLEPLLNLDIPAYIPNDYIPDTPTRLALYQRLVRVRDADQVQDVAEELRDRFGAPPKEVHNLLLTVRVKALCRQARVESATREERTLVLRLTEDIGGARLVLEKALGHPVHVGHRQIRLPLDPQRVPWGQALVEVLQRLADFRRQMVQMVGAGETEQTAPGIS